MKRRTKTIGGTPHVYLQCRQCQEWAWTRKLERAARRQRDNYVCGCCVGTLPPRPRTLPSQPRRLAAENLRGGEDSRDD